MSDLNFFAVAWPQGKTWASSLHAPEIMIKDPGMSIHCYESERTKKLTIFLPTVQQKRPV